MTKELWNEDERWIQTYTGKKFFPMNPKTEDLDIIDIAHALSMKCRFVGHTKQFYSVAQHSVIVSWNCSNPHLGLLHDAAEAYLPDVPAPIKDLYTQHIEMEEKICNLIFAWCGLLVFEEVLKLVKEAVENGELSPVDENRTWRANPAYGDVRGR